MIAPQLSAVLKIQHSSLVIDTLLNGVDGDGVVVAYVYCDFVRIFVKVPYLRHYYNSERLHQESSCLEKVLWMVVQAMVVCVNG